MRLKIIFAILLCSLIVPGMASAAANQLETAGEEPVKPAKPMHVYVDGQEVVTDTAPVLLKERAMLPIRAVAEALGAKVSWGADGAVAVERGTLSIRLAIGSTTAMVDGKAVQLDASAILYNGRTMVPVRFVGENLNCDVKWDQATGSVLVERNKFDLSAAASQPAQAPEVKTIAQPSEVLTGANQRVEPVSKTAGPDGPYVEEIYKHLINRDESFTVQAPGSYRGKEDDLFHQALQKDDYTAYIWDKVTYSSERRQNLTIAYTVKYRESKEQTQWVKDRVQSILSEIVQPGMNDYEKEKAIHDYVVTHVSYDHSFQAASFTAYGAAATGRAVCQGYALLMYRMLSEAGIQTRIYEGTGDNGYESISHAWNGVQLEGKWYHVDATWDDPSGQMDNGISYRYFNLTDQEMRKDHTWTKTYPAADTNFIQVLEEKAQKDAQGRAFYQPFLESIRSVREYAGTADTANAVKEIVQAALLQHQPTVSILFHGSMTSAKKVFTGINKQFTYETGYPSRVVYMPNGKDTVLLFTLQYP